MLVHKSVLELNDRIYKLEKVKDLKKENLNNNIIWVIQIVMLKPQVMILM